MIVIAATQKPSNDIVPTYVRDLFSFRMALRCTTPEASDTILGQGWAKEGFSASTLDPTSRGVGYLLAEGAVPGQDPHPLLDDTAISELAQLAAARRAQPIRRKQWRSVSEWRAVLAEVDQAACAPIPSGCVEWSLDRSTGELAEGALLVPCKDRRATVCPSCSRLYQADAWQLVAAASGRQGGQSRGGRPPPAVHHADRTEFRSCASGRPERRARPCRPRRSAGCCPHGRPLSCMLRHGKSDPAVGEPLCPECFDYRALCCGTPTCPGSGAGRAIASTARSPGLAA